MGEVGKKKCNAKRKDKNPCDKEVYFAVFCKKHWARKVFNWKSLLVFIIFIGSTFYNNYSTVKDIFSDIKEATSIKSPISFCKEDGNYRGTIPATIKIESGIIPKFRFFSNTGDQFGPIDTTFGDREFNNERICFDDILYNVLGECNLQFALNQDDYLVVSMDIFDIYGCNVGKIVDNNILINEDCMFSFNADSYAFEILDNSAGVVLSLEYILPDTVIVRGVLIGSKETFVFLDTHIAAQLNDDIDRIKEHQKQIKPIFEYVGVDFFGKRASY